MADAAPSMGFEFALPSSAASSTGDNLFDETSDFTFGDVVLGDGAGKPSLLGGVTGEIIKGVLVAIVARYAWKLMEKSL